MSFVGQTGFRPLRLPELASRAAIPPSSSTGFDLCPRVLDAVVPPLPLSVVAKELSDAEKLRSLACLATTSL